MVVFRGSITLVSTSLGQKSRFIKLDIVFGLACGGMANTDGSAYLVVFDGDDLAQLALCVLDISRLVVSQYQKLPTQNKKEPPTSQPPDP